MNAAEGHLIGIGEVVAITNSPIIAEALEQAARSGLERIWVRKGFETVGSEGVANIVFEAVSRSGTNWIWNDGPIVDVVDIVDDVDIVDIEVSVGSVDNCGEFGMSILESGYHQKKWLGQGQTRSAG